MTEPACHTCQHPLHPLHGHYTCLNHTCPHYGQPQHPCCEGAPR